MKEIGGICLKDIVLPQTVDTSLFEENFSNPAQKSAVNVHLVDPDDVPASMEYDFVAIIIGFPCKARANWAMRTILCGLGVSIHSPQASPLPLVDPEPAGAAI